MTGTLINVGTILLGGCIGTVFGERLPTRMRDSVITALGLFTLALGIKLQFQSKNALIPIGSVLIGGLLGELWEIEEKMKKIGGWLKARISKNAGSESTARFIRGFVSSSLLFCVGPMAILGSIEDGLSGNYQILAIKSLLDGFAALALSASLGEGVIFSALPILLYQGTMTLIAAQAQNFLTMPIQTELTAAGGLLIMGIGIGSLLELRTIRVANYLPALVIAPLIVTVLHLLGLQGY